MREVTKLRAQIEVLAPGSLPNDGKVIEDADVPVIEAPSRAAAQDRPAALAASPFPQRAAVRENKRRRSWVSKFHTPDHFLSPA